MSRTIDERLSDILDAIRSARVADDRMRKAEAHDDVAGVQVAFDAILHNLVVIGEAVKALPSEVVDQDPGVPWGDIAAMRDVIGHHYHRIVPAIIHRTVDTGLAAWTSLVPALAARGFTLASVSIWRASAHAQLRHAAQRRGYSRLRCETRLRQCSARSGQERHGNVDREIRFC